MRKAFMSVDKGLNYKNLTFQVPESQWSAGHNVHFCGGYVEKCGGWVKLFVDPLAGAVIHMDSLFQSNDDSFLMFITPTKCYAYTSGDTVPLDITDVTNAVPPVFIPLAGDATKPCSSDVFDDIFMFTNQVDPVKMWNGTGKIKNLPGAHAGIPWLALTKYSVNDSVTDSGHNYICTQAGTSGAAEPTWPATGTIGDGTVIWTEIGRSGLEDIDDLTYSIDSCRFIVNFAGFVIVGGLVEDGVARPRRVRWCQWNNPYRWKNNADGAGQAGWLELSDGEDWIQTGQPLSNYLIVYKERSICVLTYVGGTDIWQQRTSITGVGLLAPQAIVNLGDEHVFIGPDNVYTYNLLEPKAAGGDIKKEFFRMLDPGYVPNIRATFFEEVPEAVFSFTSINSTEHTNDMALVYNTETKAWSIRDLPMSAFGYWTKTTDDTIDSDEATIDSDDTVYDDAKDMTLAPANLCADSDGYVYQLSGHSKDGADMAFYLETGLIAFDEPILNKRLNRIQFMVSREGDYELKVEIGTTESIDEDVTWQATKYLSLDRAAKPWIDCDVTGRYFQVRLSNELADQPVRISGMVMYYTMRGAV